jgi:NADPH:quinone reductase-like Zn-dependent oxidoreductase
LQVRAFVIREHGDTGKLLAEDRRVAEPRPGEVRVKVRACALNHLDLWVRKGVPGHTFPLPLVPGSDVAGVVDALGAGDTGVEAGAEVALQPGYGCGRCAACLSGQHSLCAGYGILGESRDGGCAEYVVVPVAGLMARPTHLSFEEAASLPLTLLTAYHMLVTRAGLRPGETVLVNAAGSGVGVVAMQVALALGARVFATAGSEDKRGKALALGAEAAIDYRSADVSREVKRLTAGKGVDVVVDHVGRDTFQANLRSLARGGRLVFCGVTSGPRVEMDLTPLFFKGQAILGSTMGGMGEMLEAWNLVLMGRVKPVVDRVFPLSDIAAAHEYLESRQAFGKVVLELA